MANEERRIVLAARVKELMNSGDIVVNSVVPEYKTLTFVANSQWKVCDEIEKFCGWDVWGYYVVESVSYSSHVVQKHLVDFWTNEKEYSALVVFRGVHFREDIVEEFRSIFFEACELLGMSLKNTNGSVLMKAVREFLEVA